MFDKKHKEDKHSIEKLLEESLLFDFYGALLSPRQREVMQLYHEENYSILEIADEFGVSKQAVHDALKNAEKLLKSYETKLGLVGRLDMSRRILSEADLRIDALKARIADGADGEHILSELDEIKSLIAEFGN